MGMCTSGSWGSSTCPPWRRSRRSCVAWRSRRPPTVVLDLSKLTFLDSTGLRCIVTADERARDAGRRVVIVRGPDPVQRVFSITRLDERLEIVEDASALD